MALRRWQRPTRWRRATEVVEGMAVAYLRYGVAGITLLGGVVGWALEGTPSAAFTLAIFVLLFQAGLMGLGFALFGLANLAWTVLSWGADRLRTRNGRRPRGGPPLLPGPPPEELTPLQRTRVTGRVRTPEPVASPLGHVPCAAFRLVGQGPRGEVDDAGGRSFDVITEEGPVKVVLGEAWLDLPVAGAPVTVRPDERLRRFLSDRGIYPELGPVRLAEGVLRDGDSVEIEGRAEEMVTSEGYRAAGRVRVFREHAGAPLTVRKLRS